MIINRDNKKQFFFLLSLFIFLVSTLFFINFISAKLTHGEITGGDTINNYINGSNINLTTTTCSGTNKVSAINNATGVVTCSTDETSAGGGNTTEEMQDAVGSGFTGNLSYNDAGNTFDVNSANILAWLDGFYARISNLVNYVGNWSADKPSYTSLTTLNNGSYLNLDWLLKSQWNSTNTSYLVRTGDTATGNYTFDTSTFFIDSTNDRVGIGTAGPTSLGSGGTLTILNVHNAGGGGLLSLSSALTTTDTQMGQINFGSTGLSGEKRTAIIYSIKRDASATSATGDLIFGTTNAGTYGDRMMITSAGNVGIGTTSPQQKLHVSGSAVINGTLNLDANKIINLANGTAAQDAVTFSQLLQVNSTASVETDPFWTANYSTFLTHATTTYVDTQNTSQTNYITQNNQSVNNWITQNNNSVNNWANSRFLLITNWNATNTSYALFSQLNNGSYLNVAETDPLAYNGTLVSLNQLNNGTYIISSILNNGSYFNTASGDSFAGNYTNFSAIYAMGTNNTFAQLTILNNGTYTLMTNSSYYLTTNPSGFYNLTSNIGNWTADKINYALLSVLNNGTYTNQFKNSNWTNFQLILNNTFAQLTTLNNGSYFNTAGNGGGVNGSGTIWRVPMWNGTTSLNNSNLYQNRSSFFGINTTNSKALLTLTGNNASWTAGIIMAGIGTGGGTFDDDSGLAQVLTFNNVGNRQWSICDSEGLGLDSANCFRFIVGFDLPIIDAVDGDANEVKNVNFGGLGVNIGIGHGTSQTQAGIKGKLHILGNSTVNTPALLIDSYTGAEKFRVENDGQVGIGVSVLGSDDAITAVGNINISGCYELFNGTIVGGLCISDIDTKKNLKDYTTNLSKLLSLSPKEFEYKSDKILAGTRPTTQCTSTFNMSTLLEDSICINTTEEVYYEFPLGFQKGFVADEVEKYYPEFVSLDEFGFKRVEYGFNWIFELWKQNQEQQKEIILLKSELCLKDGTYSWCRK